MFDELTTCKPEELQEYAETFIRILWNRVSELTDEQEKRLHQLGRKVRKRFNMEPIRQ